MFRFFFYSFFCLFFFTLPTYACPGVANCPYHKDGEAKSCPQAKDGETKSCPHAKGQHPEGQCPEKDEVKNCPNHLSGAEHKESTS